MAAPAVVAILAGMGRAAAVSKFGKDAVKAAYNYIKKTSSGKGKAKVTAKNAGGPKAAPKPRIKLKPTQSGRKASRSGGKGGSLVPAGKPNSPVKAKTNAPASAKPKSVKTQQTKSSPEKAGVGTVKPVNRGTGTKKTTRWGRRAQSVAAGAGAGKMIYDAMPGKEKETKKATPAKKKATATKTKAASTKKNDLKAWAAKERKGIRKQPNRAVGKRVVAKNMAAKKKRTTADMFDPHNYERGPKQGRKTRRYGK